MRRRQGEDNWTKLESEEKRMEEGRSCFFTVSTRALWLDWSCQDSSELLPGGSFIQKLRWKRCLL